MTRWTRRMTKRLLCVLLNVAVSTTMITNITIIGCWEILLGVAIICRLASRSNSKRKQNFEEKQKEWKTEWKRALTHGQQRQAAAERITKTIKSKACFTGRSDWLLAIGCDSGHWKSSRVVRNGVILTEEVSFRDEPDACVIPRRISSDDEMNWLPNERDLSFVSKLIDFFVLENEWNRKFGTVSIKTEIPNIARALALQTQHRWMVLSTSRKINCD